MPDNNGKSEPSTERETKEWTLMFYFASDNPLAPSIVSQLKSIKDAGFHPDANVIARFDPGRRRRRRKGGWRCGRGGLQAASAAGGVGQRAWPQDVT
jgi:hypothetical protein